MKVNFLRKVLLPLATAVFMLFGSITALAGTIQIPASSYNPLSGGTFSVSADGGDYKVTMESANSLKLKCGSDTVAYAIKQGDTTVDPSKEVTINDGQSVAYSAQITGTVSKGGNYTDTLTFKYEPALVYPEISGLDAALKDITAATDAMNAETVFEIPLKLNETISGKSGGVNYNWPVQIYDVATDGTVTFGPALGKNSILFNNIATTYRMWNNSYTTSTSDCNSANYATSRIRATLIGKNGFTPSSYADASTCLTSTNCLLSCFPTSIQNNAVAKSMSIPTQWSTSNPYTISSRTTISDKLWLFSANEIYGDAVLSYYNDSKSGSQMPYLKSKGVDYSDIFVVCGEDKWGSADYWWLRVPNRYGTYKAVDVGNDGGLYLGDVDYDCYGLAPGFCLSVLN